MSAKTLSLEEAKKANLGIIEDAHRGSQALQDLIVAYHANRRMGTAHTKTRGEIAGSNKKPWRQKGTGNARAGRKSSPIWRGGGVVFGPRTRDYSKNVNKNTRRLAFSKALSDRIKEGDVLLVGAFEVKEPKTKAFLSALKELSLPEFSNLLLVASAFKDETYLAARNLEGILLMTAEELNAEHLVRYDKIIILEDALSTLGERTISNV